MLTVRINANTREQIVVASEPAATDKPVNALATILAEWMIERSKGT